MLPDSRRPRRLATVMSAIEMKAICDPDVVGGRDDRLDLGDRRGRRDGHRHDVVDEQRRRSDEPEERRQIRPGHDVRAAAVRVGAADLAVRDRDDGQQDGDGDRDLDRQEERARAGEEQDPQDLLGRVRRRADGVGAEDGQRLRSSRAARRSPPRWTAGVRRSRPERAPPVARSGSGRGWPPAWRRAGPGRGSGSTARVAARPGRDGPRLPTVQGPPASDQRISIMGGRAAPVSGRGDRGRPR